MWDEEDRFLLRSATLPGRQRDASEGELNGRAAAALCQSLVISAEVISKMPGVIERLQRRLAKHPELLANIHPPARVGVNGRRLLSAIREDKLRRMLARMLDENAS